MNNYHLLSVSTFLLYFQKNQSKSNTSWLRMVIDSDRRSSKAIAYLRDLHLSTCTSDLKRHKKTYRSSMETPKEISHWKLNRSALSIEIGDSTQLNSTHSCFVVVLRKNVPHRGRYSRIKWFCIYESSCANERHEEGGQSAISKVARGTCAASQFFVLRFRMSNFLFFENIFWILGLKTIDWCYIVYIFSLHYVCTEVKSSIVYVLPKQDK